jgi:hypothetical protein
MGRIIYVIPANCVGDDKNYTADVNNTKVQSHEA